MVDQNSGATKLVSLSDVFSSSGALQFREELVGPGVFILARISGRRRGGRRGECAIFHGEANKGKRRFGDDLRGWHDDQGHRAHSRKLVRASHHGPPARPATLIKPPQA